MLAWIVDWGVGMDIGSCSGYAYNILDASFK